ncbi:unnamed protein product [Xylocopa violacea]|uniref:Uncharacterized protein n=1 Tax=Xylocopa violacea TaxID=135666 RepID=A0ABP1NPV0_XYLVO
MVDAPSTRGYSRIGARLFEKIGTEPHSGGIATKCNDCQAEYEIKGNGNVADRRDIVRSEVARNPRELDYTGDSRIAKILPVYKKGGRTDRDGMRDGSGNVAEVVSVFFYSLLSRSLNSDNNQR